MMDNTNWSAFPQYIVSNNETYVQGGMTLRDYFAAKAMQGYCSDPDWRSDMDFSDTAYAAYKQADAMLKAREP